MLQITKKQTQQKVELYRTIRKQLLCDIEYLTYSINDATTDPNNKTDITKLIKKLLKNKKKFEETLKKLFKFTDLLQHKIKIERRQQ